MIRELSRAKVYERLLSELSLREEFYRAELARLQESKSADTKSSAGDKFETSREMIAQEIAKVDHSLQSLISNRKFMEEFADQEVSETVRNGSIIRVGDQLFLLGVSLGELDLGLEKIFLLSRSSPFGIILFGLKKNDPVQFMGKPNQINEIL